MKSPSHTAPSDMRHADPDGWDAKPFLEKVTGIVPSILYIFNHDTMSNEYANRSLAESLGYSEVDVQKMGANMLPELCHPDDLPAVLEHVMGLQDLADSAVATVEYRMRHSEGGWVWLLSYDTVFDRAPDGRVLRHVGSAADITAQKEAELRAVAEQRLAEAANEELRTFAYSLSHDLKSPSITLSMLIQELGHCDAVREDADVQELLDMARVTVGRMRTQIEDMLGYTRLIGDTPEMGPVALGPCVEDVLQDLTAEIRAADAMIDVGPLPECRGNRPMLRLLFLNLIGNALKYRDPARPLRVSVETCPDDEAGRLTIVVRDNGIGIAEEHHAQVFRLFQRLGVDPDVTGTGLGLAMCRRVARKHDGDVIIAPTVGDGCTFVVALHRPAD